MANGVGSFARQLCIGEAFPSHLKQEHCKAVSIVQRVVFSRPIVVAKHLLIKVMVEMKRFHGHIRSAQRPLQEAPEVIESLRMNLPIDVVRETLRHLSVQIRQKRRHLLLAEAP